MDDIARLFFDHHEVTRKRVYSFKNYVMILFSYKSFAYISLHLFRTRYLHLKKNIIKFMYIIL